MRALLQRVKSAAVHTEGRLLGSIDQGLLVFLGIEEADEVSDIEWVCRKLIGMRIFNDAEGQMNLSCEDVNGKILLISQFTLHASVKKGKRPSYNKAARPEIAEPIYQDCIKALQQSLGIEKVETGEFGADMQVELINDGPVTIFIDSKDPQ